MDTIMINWWAIIVAAIVSMVIGSIWYGPMLGKLWMKIMGMDLSTMSPEKRQAIRKSMWTLYLAQFVLSVISFYIFAHYIKGWQPQPGAIGGIINGLWLWLGFIMPVVAGNAMWSGKPKNLAWSLFFVTAGYNLVLYVVVGAILGGWQ